MIDFESIKNWNIGNNDIKKAYLNGTLVWQKGRAYTTPFYIQNMGLTNNNSTVSIRKNDSSAPTLAIYKSGDKINWTKLGDTSTNALTITLTPGERVYLRCQTNKWAIERTVSGVTAVYANQIICTGGGVRIGGNIMSLLYGANFTGLEVTFPTNDQYVFRSLFYSRSNNIDNSIVSVRNLILPATTLNEYCYHRMFQECFSLMDLPGLPATTLAEGCYEHMFSGCNSLVNAPKLPATTLATRCYEFMFQLCHSLVNAPELPATTLAARCYRGMFNGCDSLVNAPVILPATTLNEYCYDRMFEGCTSLESAPELPATTLVDYCYLQMFKNCSNLNYIKCLATDKSATNCTMEWVYYVADNGTFVKNPNMSSWPTTGFAGIPSGWTVQDAS